MGTVEVDKYSGWHKFGCLRFHAESDTHRDAKYKKCVELFKLRHKFATEVKLKNGKIVDVVDFTTNEIFEFETDKNIDKKRGIRLLLPQH